MLARALHKQIGHLDCAVPVLEIAYALGIDEVRQTEVDGFEGMLLTDRRRTQGRIIANTKRGPQAARFTIAHEIGHFLFERHALGESGGFRCKVSDMRQTNGTNRSKRQEVEANAFAIGLLAPPYLIAPFLKEDPQIDVIERMKSRLDLSREATVRCLIDLHDEPLAAIWAKDGTIVYTVRNENFPWIKWSRGERLPPNSVSHRHVQAGLQAQTGMQDVAPAAWTDGPIEDLYEQALVGKHGHSMTLLWASLPPPVDGSED